MTLSDAIATQAQWIQIWVTWLAIITFVALGAFVVQRRTWRYAAAVAAATAANFVVMNWLYGQVGYVRLLGLPHVLFWTPLVIYVSLDLRSAAMTGWVRWVAMVLVVSLTASLVIDYIDVARWLLGDRASLLPDS